MESEREKKVREIKIACLSGGIRISSDALNQLSARGTEELTVHEYATTGGITFALEGDVYVNAPFDEWYCSTAEPEIVLGGDGTQFEVSFSGERFPIRVLPLPGYLSARDQEGHLVTDVVFSHADRVRVSPISGCAYSCRFCDLPGKRYSIHPLPQLLVAIKVAQADTILPAKHLLISGGTATPRDEGYFDEVCEALLGLVRMPTDIMMSPRREIGIIDRLADWGLHGYSLNMEVFGDASAAEFVPQKHRLGHEVFAASIQRAVERTGGKGRVRSLLVVGLEEMKSTLDAVEFLARLGCDPVLSPFRPSASARLHARPPPTGEWLAEILVQADEISRSYGVRLGPRCIPCQHNTLTFPDSSGAYYFS